MRLKKALAFSLLLAAIPAATQAALHTTRVSEGLLTPTKDGVLGANEYGTGNIQRYAGAGTGFGGVLNGDSIYIANDATNLYLALDPNADLNDIAVIYLNTRPGGFLDADMNDTADGGRTAVSNNGPAGDDVWPTMSSPPDFAVVVGNFGTVVFKLNAGNTPNHLDFVAFDGTFTTNNPALVREVVIPWASLETPGNLPVDVEFFVTYQAPGWLSNESVPPSPALNGAPNPGNTGIATYENHNLYKATIFTGSGTYYVGPGGNFPNLSSFVQAISGIIQGEGTVAIAANSTAVVGTGTAFLSEVRAGDKIQVGSVLLDVASVETDTALTLVTGPTSEIAAGNTYTINRPAPAITGNVTALITGDFAEPKNVPVLADFSVHTLTIKPAPATQPTITFTRATDNSGLTGHLIIGGGINNANILSNTVDNVVIDGSNTISGTTRDLTLQTNATFAFSALIVINGDNDNVQIRHTRIINNSNSTGASTSGIRAQTANVTANTFGAPYAGTAGFADPDNWVVHNCEISVIGNPTGGQGHGIRNSVSGTPTGAFAQNNFQITNNDITAVIRGVFVDAGMDGSLIENNRFFIPGRSGFDTYGIFMNNGRAPGGTTTTRIRNNMIVVRNTSGGALVTGGWGIRLLSAGALGNSFVIENNTIDVENTGTFNAGVQPALCGIQMTSGVTGVIRHNSIALRGPGMSPSAHNAIIAGFSGPTTVNGNFTIVNNTISSSVPNLVLIRNERNVSGQPFVSNFNNLFAGGSALTGLYLTTTYATLANWQTAPPLFDAASVAVNPAPFTGGESLHLISDPGASFQTTNVIGGTVANDIDGQARGLTSVYYGADEFSANNAPTGIATSGVASVNENVASATLIGRVRGVDPDSLDFPIITATASAGTVSVSRISPSEFRVNLTSAVNYETDPVINVTLTATDRAGATTSQVVAITVNDVNEAPTAISPTTASVDENVPLGTVVATLTTTDPDIGQSHTYALVNGPGDTDNALFAISGSNLVTAAALDYEAITNPLSVRVQTTDNGAPPLSFTGNIAITVNDLPDNPAAIAVTTGTLDFGTVQIGNTADLTTTISNTGDLPLTISALTITGADAAGYSIIGGPVLPATVNNGSPLTLTVRFAPTLFQTYNNAALEITHNAPGSPTSVTLLGTGQGLSVGDWTEMVD